MLGFACVTDPLCCCVHLTWVSFTPTNIVYSAQSGYKYCNVKAIGLRRPEPHGVCARACLQKRMGSPPRSQINGVHCFPPPQARFTVSSFTSPALVAVHCVLCCAHHGHCPQLPLRSPLTLTTLLRQTQHSPSSALPAQTRTSHSPAQGQLQEQPHVAQDLLSRSGLRLLGKSFLRLRPQLISSKYWK